LPQPPQRPIQNTIVDTRASLHTAARPSWTMIMKTIKVLRRRQLGGGGGGGGSAVAALSAIAVAAWRLRDGGVSAVAALSAKLESCRVNF